MSQITFIDKNKNISNAINGVSTITSQTFTNNKYYYLQNMHLNGLWLKCNCVQQGAISFVRDNGNTYSLVNKGAEGEHAQACPLWTLVNQGEGEPSPPKKGMKINKFNPVPIADSVAGGNARAAGRGEAKPRPHRIHTLLCSLLAGDRPKGTMKLNQYHKGKSYNLHSVYFSNVASASVCNKIKVKDLLLIYPGKEDSISSAKVEKMKGSFDSKTAPQYYTILLVDNLTYNDVNKTTSIHKDGKVKTITFNKTTHCYPRTSGPRVCFIVNAIIDGIWINQIIYTHPVVSPEHPILVDSDLERQFFNKLVEKLPEKAVVIKPYFCDDFHGRILKPDFIISNGSYDKDNRKSLVVEVMGLVDDPEYIARKRELIPLMEKRYSSNVIEVLPNSVIDSINTIIQSIS